MSKLQEALDGAFPIFQMGGLSGAMYPADEGEGQGWAISNEDWEVIAGAIRELIEDPVAHVRRGVESGTIEGWTLIERDRIRYCPFCGRLVERENPDDEMCLPTNCDAWKVKAKFDHDTREWEPVSDGGSET